MSITSGSRGWSSSTNAGAVATVGAARAGESDEMAMDDTFLVVWSKTPLQAPKRAQMPPRSLMPSKSSSSAVAALAALRSSRRGEIEH